MTMAAALEDRYDATLIDGNVDRDAVRAACDAVATQRVRRRRRHRDGRAAGRDRDRDVARRCARRGPTCRSSGAAISRRCIRTVALNNDYVDFVVRGQGEDTFGELLAALARRRARRSRAIDGLSWRRDGVASCTTASARFSARAHRAGAALRPAARPARVSREDLPRASAPPAHQAALGCRFRCTFCGVAAMFSGATALPPAERLDRELAYPQARARRRLDPVLRSQLLRPRRGHGAAARGARAPRAAVVVLRARRRAGEPLARNRGGSCARAGCAWPTSAPRRPTTGC